MTVQIIVTFSPSPPTRRHFFNLSRSSVYCSLASCPFPLQMNYLPNVCVCERFPILFAPHPPSLAALGFQTPVLGPTLPLSGHPFSQEWFTGNYCFTYLLNATVPQASVPCYLSLFTTNFLVHLTHLCRHHFYRHFVGTFM